MGGGIYAEGTNNDDVVVNIYNSYINNNEASYGAGIYIYKAVGNIVNTTFKQNNCNSWGTGGAMGISSSDVTLKGCVISNNTAGYGGGGLIISSGAPDDASSNVNISDTIIQYNIVAYSISIGGGGLLLENNINIIIRESSFISNVAIYSSGYEIYAYGSQTISIINTHFNNPNNQNNFANDNYVITPK